MLAGRRRRIPRLPTPAAEARSEAPDQRSHRNANGDGVNGEGVKTIKAVKTIKTIQTPKTYMRTRKLSNRYRKTIEKLQLNE